MKNTTSWRCGRSYACTKGIIRSDSVLTQRIYHYWQGIPSVGTCGVRGGSRKKVNQAFLLFCFATGHDHAGLDLFAFAQALVLKVRTDTDGPANCLAVMVKTLDRIPVHWDLSTNGEALQRNRRPSSCLCGGSSSTGRSREDRCEGRESAELETGQDENEATEADLSRTKQDETSPKRWMVTAPLYPMLFASGILDARNTEVQRRRKVAKAVVKWCRRSYHQALLSGLLYAYRARTEHRSNRIEPRL
jgi:hypothetical protein